MIAGHLQQSRNPRRKAHVDWNLVRALSPFHSAAAEIPKVELTLSSSLVLTLSARIE